jgi:Ca2+-transporting ATPase
VLLGRQFASPLIYILVAAAVIAGAMGHKEDVIIILAVLVFNAAIGFYQEKKAERAINSIKSMSAPKCVVRRNGIEQQTPAKNLVPGDLIVLEEGDRIPADCRLLSVSRLRVEEAIFTGETIAADKQIEALENASALGDKLNMTFMGTHVISGRGEAIVTATAMSTQLGKIAGLVQSAEEIRTPLQKKLDAFSHSLIYVVLLVCVLMFVSSHLIHGQPLSEVIMLAIALAVSAIPEGLPVVITLVLSIGVRRMAKRRALIRKLPTVETLGSATIICTDKTGTLTRNEMMVTRIAAGGQIWSVSGTGYACEGEIVNEQTADKKNEGKNPLLEKIARCCVFCNNSHLKKNSKDWEMIGDPTEGALMALAGKYQADFINLRDNHKRLGEIPFDSRTKFMITLHEFNGQKIAFLKGALEPVLNLCKQQETETGSIDLSDENRSQIRDKNEEFASSALRVIGLAYKIMPPEATTESFLNNEQSDFIFLGMAGMIDPPRAEAVTAVTDAKKAGIRVIMITGDHATTARAIAEQIGIFEPGMEVMTGAELKALSDKEFDAVIENIAVYARTSPEDKMRIVQTLQAHNHVVSMTGDGVNDAPALTRADIGVSMGITGTDVACEASGMVLVDDNFASIVAAVAEGRVIFNNLRKTISFLLSTNAGEVLILLTASLLGLPAPLKAAQILWVNLVTDGFTSIALGVDPAEGDEMSKPPRNPQEPLLTRPMLRQLIAVSIVMCIGVLGIYQIGLLISQGNKDVAITMSFGAAVFFQLFNIFNCRSFDKSAFSVGFFSNKALLAAVAFAAVLQLAGMYTPGLRDILGAVPLNGQQMLITLLVSFTVLPVMEFIKFLTRPNGIYSQRISTRLP